MRADELRDLEARDGDAAADAPDEHMFAWLQSRACDEHSIRRERSQRERRGLRDVGRGRNAQHIRCGHH